MKKDLILFGYTGSIGKQVLEVLSSASCKYRIVGIVSYSRTDGLDKILKKFKSIEAVGIVKGELNISGKKIYMGNVLQMISDYKNACVFNAVSGVNGLEVSLEAIDLGRTLFLANKESIVIGYKLLKKSLKANPKAKIIPIDSEHSSLYKLLSLKQKVKSIYITCSGGALRDLPLEKVGSANYEMVKKHPTWSMGDKITVDCATLVNKAFEVIEARFFFDYDFDSIHVLMHDESLISSMISEATLLASDIACIISKIESTSFCLTLLNVFTIIVYISLKDISSLINAFTAISSAALIIASAVVFSLKLFKISLNSGYLSSSNFRKCKSTRLNLLKFSSLLLQSFKA